MLKRIISGTCYIGIIVGFFFLREYVSYLAFDVLLCFFCGVGAFEIARALKGFFMPCGFWVATISGIVLPILFAILRYLSGKELALIITAGVLLLLIIALAITKFVIRCRFVTFGITVFSLLYPLLGIIAMSVINGINGEGGLIGLLLVFTIPAFSDTLAYVVGITANKIKKGNTKKLCPQISPNKTWAGAVGAVIGGALAGIVVFAIFTPYTGMPLPMLVFAFIGFVASIINIFGDLFESFVKRKVGIKDMGKIMPGHGGVMDRIDGMLFTAIYVLFVVLIIWN